MSRVGAPVLVLAWLLGINLRAPLTASGPMLPLIMSDLRLSAIVAGAVTALPFLVIALVSIPGGLLSDAVGIRRMAIGGLLAVSLIGAGRGLATTPAGLLAMLVALGAVVGLVQPTLGKIAQASPAGPTVTTAVYTNGLNVGVLAASALSVPLLLPLVGRFSWRGVFVVWGVFSLITFVVWWAFMARMPLRPAPSPSTGPAASRAGRGVLLPLVLIFGAQGAAFNGLLTWLPGYLVSRGFDLVRGSVALAAMSLASIVAALVVPKLAGSPPHYQRPFYLSSALLIGGHLGLLARPDLAAVWSAVAGLGIGLSFTYALALPADLAPAAGVGTMVGMVLSLGYVGAVAAPLAMGALRDLSGSLAPGIALLAAVGVVPAVAARALLPGPSRSPVSAADR
jgi:CP family cyanate transporter-like MFS transporter